MKNKNNSVKNIPLHLEVGQDSSTHFPFDDYSFFLHIYIFCVEISNSQEK